MFDFIDDNAHYKNDNCDVDENLEDISIGNDEFCLGHYFIDDSTCEESTIDSENSPYHNSANHSFCGNPYESGFDEEHPLPTYDELRNAGFTDFEAKQITYHTYTVFSEKELFEVLYSENPKEAYDAMMRKKLDDLDDHINTILTII